MRQKAQLIKLQKFYSIKTNEKISPEGLKPDIKNYLLERVKKYKDNLQKLEIINENYSQNNKVGDLISDDKDDNLKLINSNSKRIISKKNDNVSYLNEDKKKSKQSEAELKIYFQNPINTFEGYKIILEFNAIPFAPKRNYLNLDLLDDNSNISCIIEILFQQNENKIILILNFICKSNENKFNSEKSKNFYLENQIQKIINDEEIRSQNDIFDSKNNIQIEVELEKYNDMKYLKVDKQRKIINNRNNFDGFSKVFFEIKDNYDKYQKLFYIIKIRKFNSDFFEKNLSINNGIINEGNTCYMNSLIQFLYNCPFFVINIISINTNSEKFLKEEHNKNKKIIISLKKIFYKLFNNNDCPISIKEIFLDTDLINFWNSQQDIEEIFTKIYEIISLYNNNIQLV